MKKFQGTGKGTLTNTQSWEKRKHRIELPTRGRRYVYSRMRAHYPDREVPAYIEGKKYARWELQIMADDILYKDGWWGGRILHQEQLKDRLKREIYVSSGTPDPSYVQGLYWRTHPQGRKWKTEEERKKHGAGFYS